MNFVYYEMYSGTSSYECTDIHTSFLRYEPSRKRCFALKCVLNIRDTWNRFSRLACCISLIYVVLFVHLLYFNTFLFLTTGLMKMNRKVSALKMYIELKHAFIRKQFRHYFNDIYCTCTKEIDRSIT